MTTSQRRRGRPRRCPSIVYVNAGNDQALGVRTSGRHDRAVLRHRRLKDGAPGPRACRCGHCGARLARAYARRRVRCRRPPACRRGARCRSRRHAASTKHTSDSCNVEVPVIGALASGACEAAGEAAGAVGGLVGEAAGAVGNGILEVLARWMIGAATQITGFVAREMQQSTHAAASVGVVSGAVRADGGPRRGARAARGADRARSARRSGAARRRSRRRSPGSPARASAPAGRRADGDRARRRRPDLRRRRDELAAAASGGRSRTRGGPAASAGSDPRRSRC